MVVDLKTTIVPGTFNPNWQESIGKSLSKVIQQVDNTF
jgi:hypothetical protein